MALSSEQIYDELNGEEVKQILLTRLRDLLDTVADFQKHLTLPRVRASFKIRLEIYGRRNPTLDLNNDLTLTLRHPVGDITLSKELEAEDEVNADTGVPVPGTPFDGTGSPPDQVREEHGLHVLEPVKDRAGITQQRPITWELPDQAKATTPAPTPPAPTPALPGGRRYAAFHTLERGGPVVQGFTDYLPGKEPILNTSSADREKPQKGIQKDFRDVHRPE